jgi:hypothetical protein
MELKCFLLVISSILPHAAPLPRAQEGDFVVVKIKSSENILWIRFLLLIKDMRWPQIHRKSKWRPLILLRKDEGPQFFMRTGDGGPKHLSNTRTSPLFLRRRGEKSLPSSRICDGPTSPTRMSDGPLYPYSTRDGPLIQTSPQYKSISQKLPQ